jgi:ABC-type multidrug transport system fused ATPase/permease subunit
MIWDQYRTFGPYLRPYVGWFALAYVAMGVFILFRTLTPFPLKWTLDYVLLHKPLPEGRVGDELTRYAGDLHGMLVILCIAMVAMVLIQNLFSYMQKFVLAAAARRANNDIRNAVFERLQVLPLAFHGNVRTGDLIVRLTEDINMLRKLLIDSVSDLAKMFFTFGWVAVLMCMVDWQLTLIALSIGFPIYFLTRRFTGKVEELAKEMRTKESEVGSILVENLSSMAIVKAFSNEDRERQRFGRETHASLRADIRRLQLSKGFGRLVDFLGASGTAVVVYYAGSLAIEGRLEATTLVLFAPWLKELYSPLEKLAELIVELTRQLVSGERIAEILRTDITLKDADDAVAAPPLRGEVAFDHVTFGYKKEILVLEDLTFAVRPGQMVALVGSSGAGKSTIVNLILRFFDPWQGGVIIDGQDIRRFTLESLRRQMTVLLQETLLMRRTVRENIALGKPDADLAAVEAAAKAAHIHDFIETLPNGYDSILGERGADLSGGQRQRIALARAILRDAPILILDEPVTGLDAITAARLRETIAEVAKGRTTFVIAHTLSMIERADLILVLDKGRIVEHGTHDELMARSRVYAGLYETQHGELGARVA